MVVDQCLGWMFGVYQLFDTVFQCVQNRLPERWGKKGYWNPLVVPGRVAQSVGHLTRKSGVLGSIPGLATYFRFSFRFFKMGSCQLLAKVCAQSTGQPLRRSKPVQEKCGQVN